MRERKFRKERTPRKVILVICEGETEKNYVEHLKIKYRLPIAIKSKIAGNRINSRLVNQFINETGIDNDVDSSVFYVYDADVNEVVERLKGLPGKLILSNPCFELWYLLHVKDHKRHVSSKEIIKILEDSAPEWKGYSKGCLSEIQKKALDANQHEAVARSKKLVWPDNPSSNMHIFIDILENEKKR